MVLDQILIGLLTNAMSEVTFRTIDKIKDKNKKDLKPSLDKAYNHAISETEQKYPKSTGLMSRVLKSAKVKRRILSLKGGKLEILQDLKELANEKKKKRDNPTNSDDILEYFYKKLIASFKDSPELQEYLRNAYVDEIARLSKDTNTKVQSLPFIFRDVQDIKKGIAKLIAENSKLQKLKNSNFAYRLSAFQIKIFGVTYSDIKNIIDVSYKLEEVKDENNEMIIEFTDESEDINVIRLMYEGSLYKVIYPPEKSYVIWMKQMENYIEMTCFIGNKHKKEEILSILKTHIDSPIIKEVTFDEKITAFLKDNLRNVTQLKYNPQIKKEIKLKNGTHTIKGKIGIFVGDPGFLEDDKVKTIMGGLQTGGNNKHSDVFYFKTESLPNIYSSPMDFDFHRDGRIVGFFGRKNLSLETARKTLYSFILKNGKEF